MCYRYLFLATFPMISAGVLFAPTVVRTLYGASYAEASRALPWLFLAELPIVAGVVYGHFSVAANRQRYDIVFTLINAVTNLVLCAMLIPRFGLVGAAVASLVSYSVSIPVQLFFRATRKSSIVLLRELARIGAVALLTWVGFFAAGTVLPLAYSVGFAIAIFLCVSILTKLITRKDLQLFSELVFP
jgi:O-antigen/teichoic acid export membrane protein